MHAASRIPAPGTYDRVLRRYDRDPQFAHQQKFASYDVHLRAVNAEMKGRSAMTLFFPKGKGHAADRATRFGWIDETAAWNAEQDRDTALGEPGAGSALGHALSSMKWHDLVAYTEERGIRIHGLRRPQVEEAVIEWHMAQGTNDAE